MKEYNKPRQSNTLQTLPSPQLDFLIGVFLANRLARNENLNITTKNRTHTNKN